MTLWRLFEIPKPAPCVPLLSQINVCSANRCQCFSLLVSYDHTAIENVYMALHAMISIKPTTGFTMPVLLLNKPCNTRRYCSGVLKHFFQSKFEQRFKSEILNSPILDYTHYILTTY